MESSLKTKSRKKISRAIRVRRKLRGTASRPRLCVTKSNSHLYAQLIDDDAGLTLGACGTLSKEMRSEVGRKGVDSAKKLGGKIAEIAKEKNIESVIFDRGSAKYHGVLAALADAAREGGLKF